MAATTLRILHISDLHARGSRERKQAWRRQRVLGDAWRRNLDELAGDGRAFDLVVFTGDIADWGKADEYAQATVFVDEVLARLGVARDRFFAIPGNHDVDRKTEEEPWKQLRRGIFTQPQPVSQWLADAGRPPFGFDPSWRETVLSRQRAFWDWVEGDLGRPELLPSRSPHGRLGYRITVPHRSVSVHVIGLDSAWLAGDGADSGRLWLTEDQVGRLCRDDSGEELGGFRLVLVHHPLGDLADHKLIGPLLTDSVDLLLRGHQHNPLAETRIDPDRSFRELAAGCLYEGHQGNRYPNACQVIDAELDPDGRPLKYEVRFRAFSPNGHWYDDGALYREARGGRLTWTLKPRAGAILPGDEIPPPLIESVDLPADAGSWLRDTSRGITVRSGTRIRRRGSAWLVEPDLVVTAFHVVGDLATRVWWHQREDGVRYTLWIADAGSATRGSRGSDEEEIELEPLIFDPETDLAVLRAARPAPQRLVRTLAARSPAAGTRWHSRAFPRFQPAGFALTGGISELHGTDAKYALKLEVGTGPRPDWHGVAGAPICEAETGLVLGIITQMTDATAVGWGTTAGAVTKLLQHTRDQTPTSTAVLRAEKRWVRRIMEYLNARSCIGVALLEPLGFGARQVVDELLVQLRRSDDPLLPIRLVPTRRSNSEARLCRKLLRDLQSGLRRTENLDIPADWWTSGELRSDHGEPWDHFEDAVAELLNGPLYNRRTLLFLVDGLASMPTDQAVRWGYMMKELCDAGLKLVVWGGRELYELITAPRHGDQTSAFHHLRPLEMKPLVRHEIGDVLAEQFGSATRELDKRVHRMTRGHPALTRELMSLAAEAGPKADPARALEALLDTGDGTLLGGTHMERLRREVERDDGVRRVLRSFGQSDAEPLPYEPLSLTEKQLKWLGIITEAGGGWRWTAPVMRRLAEEIE